MINTFQILHH